MFICICKHMYPDRWYRDELGMTKKIYSPKDTNKLSVKINIYE